MLHWLRLVSHTFSELAIQVFRLAPLLIGVLTNSWAIMWVKALILMQNKKKERNCSGCLSPPYSGSDSRNRFCNSAYIQLKVFVIWVGIWLLHVLLRGSRLGLRILAVCVVMGIFVLVIWIEKRELQNARADVTAIVFV